MSDSIGRITSAGVPVKWKGREYLLGKFSFRDRGLIENVLIREKRRRKMQVVLDMREMLSPEEYREQFDNARREAELIGSVSENEVETYLMTNEGLSMFLWVLFEDRYPGAVQRVEIEEMFASNTITPDMIVEILLQLKDALGVSRSGNLTGHNHPQAKAEYRRHRRRSRRRKA